MKKILLGLLLAASAITGFTAPQASNGRDTVILREKECSSTETLSHIPAEYKKYFFDAEVFLKGTQYKACWTLQGENVLLVYPDGDQGMLPVTLFKEAGI